MAAAVNEKTSPTIEREENVLHTTTSLVENEKPVHDEERDYTGTAAKTDPEEIRLVRKLDYRIMVRSHLPYSCRIVFPELTNGLWRLAANSLRHVVSFYRPE
jgi:hypothetical protein